MAPTVARQLDLEAVLDHLRAHHAEHLEEFLEFLRIASVSAQEEHRGDVRRAGEWLAARLRRAGLENVELVETSLHPSVVADWLHAGPEAPTLVVYGHYDVQPAGLDDGWRFDPFEPRVEDGRVWGRGTTDDKGQLLAHVYAAEAWLTTHGRLPVNVKMVFEGEEELGSLHFSEVLDKAGDRLAGDLLIVSDSPMLGEGKPAITYSLRGLCYVQVDLRGPVQDLHSGTFGGIVWNPNEALVHMLASLKDPATGRILVDGFYDDVIEPTAEERAALASVSDSDEAFLAGAGTTAGLGEAGWSNAERVGLRPTLEINGIWGGYTGEGAKTVIPSTAHAKISCRLVADQDPDQIASLLESHLRARVPDGMHIEVSHLGHGHGVRADPNHPLVAVIASALEETWNHPAALIPEGGSIPAVADMQRRLGAIPILAGFGHKDENMHAPEESYRLDSFNKGREAAARMLHGLAGGAPVAQA